MDGDGVAVMAEPGTRVDGAGGAMIPEKYGASVAGSVVVHIVVTMDNCHRQRWRRDAASGRGHHPGEDTG